jgi:hypothetical protein
MRDEVVSGGIFWFCNCLLFRPRLRLINNSFSLRVTMASSLTSLIRVWRAALLFVVAICLTPELASAECGDYVVIQNAPKGTSHHHLQATTSESQSDRIALPSPVGRPCNGPNCSNSPGRKFPPQAPVTPVNVRLKEMTQPLIPSGSDATPGFMLERDRSSLDPIDQISSIFHPPRLL